MAISLKDHDTHIITDRRYVFSLDTSFVNVDYDSDDETMDEDDGLMAIGFSYDMHVHYAADLPSMYDFLLDQWILHPYAREYRLIVTICDELVATMWLSDGICRKNAKGELGTPFKPEALRHKIEKYMSNFSKKRLLERSGLPNLQAAIDVNSAKVKELMLSLTFVLPKNSINL
jgi:hypothetical protein